MADRVEPSPQTPLKPVPPGMPVYPPSDQGVIKADAQDILATQMELLRRIKLMAGTDEKDFERRYMSVIRRLAGYIQLLPASESDTHPGPGGLFRLTLELAFFSGQAAEAVVFAGRATAEDRRREESRWRYAAFLAGMCCELHRCVTSMKVVDVKGNVWPAFNVGLSDWLSKSGSDHYFVRWSDGPVGSMSITGLLVERIVGSDNLQFLQNASLRIVPAMMDTIAGVRTLEKSALADVVDNIRQRVILRDKSVQPANYGKHSIGTHLEPHLLDAMRQLLASGQWRINEKKARLWYSKEGLYLVWRLAAKEILGILAKDSVKGVPQEAQTLLEMLLAAKVFVQDKDGSPYWMIFPPGSTTELPAVRFLNPMTLFGTMLEEIHPVDTLESGSQPGSLQPTSMPNVPGEIESQSSAMVDGSSITSNEKNAPATKEFAPQDEPAQSMPLHSPGGAIPEVTTDIDAEKMPAAVAATLRPAMREVMNTVLSDYSHKKSKDRMGPVEHGFAISIEYLAGFGVTLEELLKQLHEAGWLYCSPEKPNKKLHQVVLNNRKLDVIVIKSAQARDVGFVR